MERVTKNEKNVRDRIQNILLLILMTLVLIMLYEVEKFSDAGRLINYAGFARSGAQRYVKLSYFGIHDRDLIERYNKVLDGLWNGSEELKLPKIHNKNFRKNLEIQREKWIYLYDMIEAMEHSGGGGEKDEAERGGA